MVLDYWKYADALRLLAPKNIDWEHLRIKFVMPMPKSWSRKKCIEMAGKPHKVRPDLSNILKAVEDILLKEDSHVWHYADAKKVWGVKGCIAVGVL